MMTSAEIDKLWKDIERRSREQTKWANEHLSRIITEWNLFREKAKAGMDVNAALKEARREVRKAMIREGREDYLNPNDLADGIVEEGES